MISRPKFIIDMNVGKLAVWLRALGYDTKFINPIDDGDLVRIAEEDQRILLTKDNGIFERKKLKDGHVRGLYVEGSDWRNQMKQLVRHFTLNDELSFSRCLLCNELLVEIAAEQAPLQGLPEDVIASHSIFWICPHCQRFYWRGGHWLRMKAVLDEIMRDDSA